MERKKNVISETPPPEKKHRPKSARKPWCEGITTGYSEVSRIIFDAYKRKYGIDVRPGGPAFARGAS
jgi:hypothetical protein